MEEKSFVEAFAECKPFEGFTYENEYNEEKQLYIAVDDAKYLMAYIDFVNSVYINGSAPNDSEIQKAFRSAYVKLRDDYLQKREPSEMERGVFLGRKYINLLGQYYEDEDGLMIEVMKKMCADGWGYYFKYDIPISSEEFHQYSSLMNLTDYVRESMNCEILYFNAVTFETSLINEYGENSEEVEEHRELIGEFEKMFVEIYPQWAGIFEKSNATKANDRGRS